MSLLDPTVESLLENLSPPCTVHYAIMHKQITGNIRGMAEYPVGFGLHPTVCNKQAIDGVVH